MGFASRILIISFFVLLISMVINVVLRLDLNKRVYNHYPGQCQQIPGVEHGSEDIALVESMGIAFISSGIFYMEPRPERVKGKIFLYDFNDSEVKVHQVPLRNFTGEKSFGPHGMSHFESKDGVRLFVINHNKPDFTHTVEVFKYDSVNRELIHEKSIRDEKLVRPNDLVAVGSDSFIFTNDGTSQTTMGNVMEVVTGYSFGSVGYYDGKESHWLLSTAVSPNGIAIDRTHGYLLVSHINDEKIGVYRLNKNFKSMELLSYIPLLTAADNFYLDKDNSLWTGTHPILYEALGHLGACEDMTKKSSSQVLRIKFTEDFSKYDISEPFTDDGSLIAGSSVAVFFKNQLLVGSVCRQLVHCTVTDVATL